MPVLSVSNSVCYSLIYRSLGPDQSHICSSGPHQHCGVLLDNNGQQTLPKIWLGTFLVRSVQPKGKLRIDSNGKI